MSVPLWMWAATIAVILAMLAVDLLAHRREQADCPRQAVLWTMVWLILGVSFGGIVWVIGGAQHAGEYFGGYLIEKSLAVDNIFVFALVFSSFAVPRAHQHRVLFFGVLGALIMRGAFIAGGAALISRFDWVLYVFGGLLLLAAWRMVRTRGGHSDPRDGRSMGLIRRVVRTVDGYQGQKFLVRRAGRLAATPLLVVLILIEASDLVFAVDSIPAVFAVTHDPFLVFTSNAFAILGLRALYFLLADLMHRFTHLKLGLAVVLGFVGVKMLLLDVVHIPIVASLAVIAAVLAVAIGASLRGPPRKTDRREPTPGPRLSGGAVGSRAARARRRRLEVSSRSAGVAPVSLPPGRTTTRPARVVRGRLSGSTPPRQPSGSPAEDEAKMSGRGAFPGPGGRQPTEPRQRMVTSCRSGWVSEAW